ncbi:carboxymuconolactone decarboxylase family protein [Nocardiopsis sp. RV163]|nr:carboxymuconolactone decarboxylase family protein [Nocardiopsis sp. RV163]
MNPGAPRSGLKPDEIGEALLQAAVYRGAPAVDRAFGIAREDFAEQDG